MIPQYCNTLYESFSRRTYCSTEDHGFACPFIFLRAPWLETRVMYNFVADLTWY